MCSPIYLISERTTGHNIQEFSPNGILERDRSTCADRARAGLARRATSLHICFERPFAELEAILELFDLKLAHELLFVLDVIHGISLCFVVKDAEEALHCRACPPHNHARQRCWPTPAMFVCEL